MPSPIVATDLFNRELEHVTDCLQSGEIGVEGKYVGALERRLAQVADVRHAVAAMNGSAALHLALMSLNLRPGDEVILPTLANVAAANAVCHCGAIPVFADSEPDTSLLSVKSVQRLLSPDTRGIIPVHLYGQACDMQPLMELAHDQCLWVVEDATQALGATYDGKPVGSFGNAGVFSFGIENFVTTGAGGMIVTNEDRLDISMRILRDRGQERTRRHEYLRVGYDYAMTNLTAAIGVAQMERFEQLQAHRRSIADWYHKRLRGWSSLTLPSEQPPATSLYQSYPIIGEDGMWREQTLAGLMERGIEARPFASPLHEYPMYRGSRADGTCPVARWLSERSLCLPASARMIEADVDRIVHHLGDILQYRQAPVRLAA